MRPSLPLITLIFAVVADISHAQFMTGKEASAMDALLQRLSVQHQLASYIFRNVNILTMDDSQIVEQDVGIANGQIKEIGSDIQHQYDIEIDGRGKYLMPGLIDMHVHLFDHHQMKNTWMLLLLLNGVTSVRDMAGEPGKLALKDKIRKNEILAPNLYQAGPILNGLGNQAALIEVASAEEGRKQVIAQKEAGYDFIKVYDDLAPDTYFAILEEAKKQDIPVVGHIPTRIGIEEALNKQSTVEHLTGYKGWKHNTESYLIAEDDYAVKTGQSDTWNCPTLYNLLLNWDKSMAEEVLTNQNIASVLPDKLVKRWERLMTKDAETKEAIVAKHGKNNQRLFRQIVLNLYNSNARLLAGTDAGSIPLLVPGFSMLEELAVLNAIGIPNYEVLKMATVNAAEAMNKEEEFGTIITGKRADLILLNGNPLEDMSSLNSRAGVMVRGIWLSGDELERINRQIIEVFGHE